jgi:drug/metabolite transporter (DMT)-like permease
VSASSRTLAGIGFVLAAVACFAVLDTATKITTASVPVLMALWFRYAFQAVATTAVILPLRGRAAWRTEHPRFQLARGLLLLATSVFAFFSLRFLPVGEFTAIVMLVPLVVTIAAALTLGERVTPLRWLLVLGGFVGALVIIRPGSDGFHWLLLLPLGLVACNSAFQVLTSKLARSDDALTTHCITGWIGTLLTSLALPFVWETPASWDLWLSLLLMGLMGTVGHFLLIQGFARAPASTLTPYLYGQIGFAVLAGWIMFSHVPAPSAIAGMVLITVCGALGGWLTVHESRSLARLAKA